MYIAVIDLGKTNSKLALVNTELACEVAVLTQPASVNSNTPYPSLDHDSIGAFLFASLRQLAAEHRIDAITVTTHGATAALIDRAGQLVLPVVDYEYDGIDQQRAGYNQIRPAFSETGSPSLPGGLNIGAQLYWLQQHFADQFARAQTMLTWPQYWVFRLTGQRHNDLTSLGCHTDLYQPRVGCYSSLVDSLQLRHLLPVADRSGKLSGTLLPSVAKQLNLPVSTPVYTGIHDSNASLVPHLISRRPPFTVVSTGTWFIAMAVGGRETVPDEQRDTLLNVSAQGQAIPSARYMGGRERDLLGVSIAESQPVLDQLMSQPEVALHMPSVVQGTGPYPHATAKWINGCEPRSSAERDCANTLYLALMTCEAMRFIGSDGPSCVEGPLSQDRLFVQMLAAASDRPVVTSGSQTGTSIGAAMLIDAPKSLPADSVVELEPQRHRQLQHYATRWRDALRHHAR
jgi:sugar (pentulose or hexulose) kinase